MTVGVDLTAFIVPSGFFGKLSKLASEAALDEPACEQPVTPATSAVPNIINTTIIVSRFIAMPY